jgi:MFS family permease
MRDDYIKANAVLFLTTLGYGITTAFLSVYLADRGISLLGIGLVFAIGAIVAGLLRVPIGIVVDCLGRKKFLILGAIGYPIFAIGLIYASTVGHYIILNLFIQFFGAIFWTAFTAHFFDIMSQGKEGTDMAGRNIVLYSASAAAPILAGIIATKFGFANLFAIGAAIAASAIFVALTIKDFNHKQQLCYRSLQTEYNCILKIKGLALIATIIFLVDFTFVFWGIFMPIWLQQQGISLEAIGLILTINLIIGVLIQIPLGKAIDKLPVRKVLIPGFFLFWLGGMVFFSLRNYISYLAGRVMLGIGSDASYWPAVGMFAKLTPKADHGGAVALIFGLSTALSGVGALIGGILTTQFGIPKVLWAVSFIPLIVAISLFWSETLKKKGTQFHKAHHHIAHVPRH